MKKKKGSHPRRVGGIASALLRGNVCGRLAPERKFPCRSKGSNQPVGGCGPAAQKSTVSAPYRWWHQLGTGLRGPGQTLRPQRLEAHRVATLRRSEHRHRRQDVAEMDVDLRSRNNERMIAVKNVFSCPIFARNALRKAVMTIARFGRHLKMSAEELEFMESGV